MRKVLTVFPFVFLFCFTFSCQDKEAMAELEAMKAQVVVEEQNREVVLKFYEELDKGNTDNALETFAPDFLYYSPSNG